MYKFKLKVLTAALTFSFCGLTYSQVYLPQQGNRGHLPDAWMLGPGQTWHFKGHASNNGRTMTVREPNVAERAKVEKIKEEWRKLPSRAIVLGEGNNIVAMEFIHPANENSTFLSASIDKTLTSLSAGIAICEGKIKLSTKAKEVLPELEGTAIGESTLRDNLMMASGTTSAFDDSQSLTPNDNAELAKGNVSLMDFMKKRWAERKNYFAKPGKDFDYKSQDPFLVGMMISAAYGNNGKRFRQWQSENLFTKIRINDRYFQGQDRFEYAHSDGITRLSLMDWSRVAAFVTESRKESGCYGDYIRQATKTQIKNDYRFIKAYHGYGYFVWTDHHEIPGAYAAVGYGGQSIIWNATNDKYFIIFSNNVTTPEISRLARMWLQ